MKVTCCMFRVLQLYCTVHCTVYIVHFSIEGLESGDGTFEWVEYTVLIMPKAIGRRYCLQGKKF